MECEFCRYPAKDLLDLGEHVYQCHGPEEEPEENPIICYICGWKLDSKEELMKHRKEKHERSVRICQYFIKGCCERSASECWYKHDSANHNIKEFKCSECDIVFDWKFDLMKHRKHEHPKHVSVCTKNRNGSCHFGEEKCWFKHEGGKQEMEEIYEENPEIITKMFDMMEKFTERFEFIENQL